MMLVLEPAGLTRITCASTSPSNMHSIQIRSGLQRTSLIWVGLNNRHIPERETHVADLEGTKLNALMIITVAAAQSGNSQSYGCLSWQHYVTMSS